MNRPTIDEAMTYAKNVDVNDHTTLAELALIRLAFEVELLRDKVQDTRRAASVPDVTIVRAKNVDLRIEGGKLFAKCQNPEHPGYFEIRDHRMVVAGTSSWCLMVDNPTMPKPTPDEKTANVARWRWYRENCRNPAAMIRFASLLAFEHMTPDDAVDKMRGVAVPVERFGTKDSGV